MSPLERLTSGLGLTRGDLRVALFLAAAALAGAIYLHFFESREDFHRRTGMARLLAVADSISTATAMTGLAALDDGSSAEWEPLTPGEVLEEGTDGEGRVELTLEDVAPIDINSAPPEILQLLPGVGEKTAAKIVAARPFSSVDDIVRVHGIGLKKLEKMRPYIVVRGERVPSATGPDSVEAPGIRVDSAGDPTPHDSTGVVDSARMMTRSDQNRPTSTTLP